MVKIHEKLRRKEGLFPCLFALGGRKVLHRSLQPKKPFFCYHFFLRRKRDHKDDRLNCHHIQQRYVQTKYDKFLHLVNKGQWPFQNDSTIKSLRPIRLKMVIRLSSLRTRKARKISFSVEPLVVTSSTINTFCLRIVAHKALSSSLLKRRKFII